MDDQGLEKMVHSVVFPRSPLRRRLMNLVGLSLIGSGVVLFVWICQLTWHDLTVWNKDIGEIFFDPRSGENIGLGIGMRVIYYYLLGLTLLFAGSIMLLKQNMAITLLSNRLRSFQIQRDERKNKRSSSHVIGGEEAHVIGGEEAHVNKKDIEGCLHSFGYLANRPPKTPIPEECIQCNRLSDCMVANIFANVDEHEINRLQPP